MRIDISTHIPCNAHKPACSGKASRKCIRLLACLQNDGTGVSAFDLGTLRERLVVRSPAGFFGALPNKAYIGTRKGSGTRGRS